MMETIFCDSAFTGAVFILPIDILAKKVYYINADVS